MVRYIEEPPIGTPSWEKDMGTYLYRDPYWRRGASDWLYVSYCLIFYNYFFQTVAFLLTTYSFLGYTFWNQKNIEVDKGLLSRSRTHNN